MSAYYKYSQSVTVFTDKGEYGFEIDNRPDGKFDMSVRYVGDTDPIPVTDELVAPFATAADAMVFAKKVATGSGATITGAKSVRREHLHPEEIGHILGVDADAIELG